MTEPKSEEQARAIAQAMHKAQESFEHALAEVVPPEYATCKACGGDPDQLCELTLPFGEQMAIMLCAHCVKIAERSRVDMTDAVDAEQALARWLDALRAELPTCDVCGRRMPRKLVRFRLCAECTRALDARSPVTRADVFRIMLEGASRIRQARGTLAGIWAIERPREAWLDVRIDGTHEDASALVDVLLDRLPVAVRLTVARSAADLAF